MREDIYLRRQNLGGHDKIKSMFRKVKPFPKTLVPDFDFEEAVCASMVVATAVRTEHRRRNLAYGLVDCI